MLNFKRCLYKNIGNRIKNIRKQMKLSQDRFSTQLETKYHISINRSLLSHIERGKAYKEKNPYLLTAGQIEGISELTKYEPIELIFGNDEERKDTVKLILLGIIANGAKYNKGENYKEEFINPFIDTRVAKEDYDEVYKQLKKRYPEEIAKKKSEELIKMNLEEFLRLSTFFIKNVSADRISYLYYHFNNIEEIDGKEIKEYIDWYKISLPFFSNKKNFESMKYFMNESNKELENPSNLLIKLLIGNYSFAKLFMERLFYKNRNQKTIPNSILEKDKRILEDFISNSGQFGVLAFDFKNAGFAVFVGAFTEMWERNNKIFMDYFNKHLFNIDLNEHGLKPVNDEFIHNLITSSEFSKIIYDRIETERYDIKTLKGHNTLGLYLQRIAIENQVEFLELPKNELFKEINDLIQMNNRLL